MTAAWNSKEELYPRVTATIFKEYASKKREGNLGQQQKACSINKQENYKHQNPERK